MRRLRQLFNLSLLIDRLSLSMAQATAVVLIIMMLLITVEVFVRKSFGISTRVAHDFSGYLLVAVAFWTAADLVRRRGHIRITVLTDHLKQKIQFVLFKANYVIAAAFILFLFLAATVLVITTYRTGMLTMGMYQIPVFIPQLAIPIGLFFLLLQIVANLFKEVKTPKK